MYPASLFAVLAEMGFSDWLPDLRQQLRASLSAEGHGDFEKWQTALQNLPIVTPSVINLNSSSIEIGVDTDMSVQQREQLVAACRSLHPWRKGPFSLFGVHIDTEWRSDWKWDRLAPHISSLAGRKVLDIGCGSGYHCWRMRGAGADFVLGIDPTMVFVMQFLLLQNYIQEERVQVLPLGIDDMPHDRACFDTVFSMGLLYHRRHPQQHLQELKGFLHAGGELVLETLIIDETHGEVLLPQGRYAQMRNVWAIPSVTTLTSWLQQAGFRDVRCVDVNQTNTEEQHSTAWMTFQSLSDFLDPADHNKTIEGYPAPRRAIMLATK